MDYRRIHHNRWFASLIALAVIVAGVYIYGIDSVSLRIAWYRLRLLSGRPETGIRQIERLAALGDRGTRHLMWCVGHDLDAVQIAAIDVLRERKEKQACPAFIRALDDSSTWVRAAANQGLEEISGESVGFDPYRSWANRRDKVRQWQEWWWTQEDARTGAFGAELRGHLAAEPGPSDDGE